MNFGVHDAANAGEKRAEVIHGRADTSLMDQYDRQRRGVANSVLQAMKIQNKQALEAVDPAARRIRALGLAAAADLHRARAHLLQTAMIAGYRAAAAIL